MMPVKVRNLTDNSVLKPAIETAGMLEDAAPGDPLGGVGAEEP